MLIQVNIFLSLAIGFTIAFFVIPKIIKVSRDKSLFDVPNYRSAAKTIVPTFGGIAIYAGFKISQAISLNNYNTNSLKYLSIAVLIMFLIGVKDDIVGISAKTKLFIQVLVAFYLVILGNYRITDLHGILGIHHISSIAAIAISVIVIVGIINALNLIDGIDGLASGLGILISGIMGIMFLNVGDYLYALTCFSLTGSLIAFFLYNVFGSTNKIFMGDTGSLILGTIIAVITIHFNESYFMAKDAAFGSPALSLAIILVPVTDTLRVFAIRIRQKRSPFSPDMNHIHHKVLQLTHGNHLYASMIIIGVNALLILLTYSLIDFVTTSVLFFLVLITGFVLAYVPVFILKIQGRNRKENIKIKENKSVFAFTVFTKREK